MLEKLFQADGAPAARPKTAVPPYALFSLLFAALLLSGCAGVTQQTNTQSSAQISVVPSSITFTNVVVGQKSSQTVQISNTGQTALNVTGISITGIGFSLSSISVPFQLSPGANKTFT